MTRTDALRVPVAALVVLVVAAGLVGWATRDWYDDRAAEPRPATEVLSSGQSVRPEGRTVIRVRVLPRGDLLVRHRIRTGKPMNSLAVSTPVDPNLAAAEVAARGLHLTAGDVLVKGAKTLRNGTSVFTFSASTSVSLRYVLSGALERADPSDTRALARVTSLDLLPDAEQGPVTYVFEGARILNLACTRRGDVEPVPCGVRRGGDWVVDLPDPVADDFRVMAQLDLLR